MPLKRDYFKCLSVVKNTKKNGEPYLFVKLQNKKGIICGYIWEKIDLYKERIKANGFYAIKFQEDIYNDSKVLNIKNINSIKGSRYEKYGYSNDLLLISDKIINDYFYNEISSFILKRNNSLMDILLAFIKKNKKIILSSGYMEHKHLCLEYFRLIENTLNTDVNSNLYIYFILIDRIDLDLNSLTIKVKDYSRTLSEALLLYSNDNKGFIKKYKSIVDLINDNLNNYTNLKKQTNGVDA